MIEIRKTEEFIVWLDNLFDLIARAKIQARIQRLLEGNPGKVKSVGEKVFEMNPAFGQKSIEKHHEKNNYGPL
jgi:putative addiction module killer protein